MVFESKKPTIFFDKKYTIDMPQMSIEGLSENWLFKELGNAHWGLLCDGLDTDSGDLKDELNIRIYATFVRIRIQSSNSLNEFNENEQIKLSGSIKRYGNGMYFSEIELKSLQSTNKSIKSNLMTSFSIRKSTGNKDLVKSQPNITNNYIENLELIDEFWSEQDSQPNSHLR